MLSIVDCKLSIRTIYRHFYMVLRWNLQDLRRNVDSDNIHCDDVYNLMFTFLKMYEILFFEMLYILWETCNILFNLAYLG